MTWGGIDLHIHSTVSDGTHTPQGAIAEAVQQQVWLLGLVDHDITDGVVEAEAAAREAGVILIPGVELSVDLEEVDIHILGYFIDVANSHLQHMLFALREAREMRNARILERLHELGAPLDLQRVQEIGGYGSIGRPHIAAALVEAGHVATPQNAFTQYLARGRPAFVRRECLSPEEACQVIHEAGGLAVLAHPVKIGAEQLMSDMVVAGIDGIEVYHCDQSPEEEEALLRFAKERSLLVTGGSDSHGPHASRPSTIGSVPVPSWVGQQLLARAPSWWLKNQ